MTTPTWHEVGSLCEAVHILIDRADLSHDLLVETASTILRRVDIMHRELLLDPHGDSDSPAEAEPEADKSRLPRVSWTRSWLLAAGAAHVPDAPLLDVLRELDPEASVWEIPCADDGPSRFVVKNRSLHASELEATPNAAVLSALGRALQQLREKVGSRDAGMFSAREAMREACVPHSQLGGGVSVADGIRYLAKQRDDLAHERAGLAIEVERLKKVTSSDRATRCIARLDELVAIGLATGVERGPNEDVVSWVARGVDELLITQHRPDSAHSDQLRTNMLINLREWMLAMEAKAELDSDPVSIEGFTDDNDKPVGGLMLIRSPEAFAAINQFCETEGLLTPGKGIEDGTKTTVGR